ncbi:MAG: hypothetical protein J5J00_03610, partial [Deltaproteobacteria bacterium]|nr:hypothetical protein [Deltaproteobacteria bacterium]
AFSTPTWAQNSGSKTPLQTPSNRFQTLHGSWQVTEAPPELPELIGQRFTLDGKSRNAVFPADDPFGSAVFLKSKGNTAKKVLGRLNRGLYKIETGGSSLNQRALEVLGSSGKLEVFFPPGTEFGSFIGTFLPDGGTVDKATFRATLQEIGDFHRPKLVVRVKKKGVPKVGEKLSFKVDILNRGPHILPDAVTYLTLAFSAPVSGVVLSKFKRIDSSCTERVSDGGEFTLVDCFLRYLGPPEKSTFGSVTAQITVPAALAGQKLNVKIFTTPFLMEPDTSGKDLFFDIKGTPPDDDDDDDDNGDGGLSEFVGPFEFTTTRNGAVFSRIRVNCRLDAGVVNCDIEDLQGTVSKYKLGDQVLKNLRFVTATTLRGDLLGAIDLQYRDSEFVISPRLPAKGLLCLDYPDQRDYAFKRP